MPIFKSYNLPGLAADLAAGVGSFRQGEAEHDMALQDARFGQSQDAQRLQGYQMLLGDQLHRRGQDLSYDRAIDSAYERGRAGEDLERLRQTGRLDVAGANNQVRERIAQGNQQTALQKTDKTVAGSIRQTELRNDERTRELQGRNTQRDAEQLRTIKARQEAAAERGKHEMAIAAEKVKAQGEAQRGRQDIADKRLARAGRMEQLVREQKFLDEKMERQRELGQPVDDRDMARFQQITAELRTMTGLDPVSGMDPMAQPGMGGGQGGEAQPVAPQGFQPSPFLPPEMQPGAAQPPASFGDPFGGAGGVGGIARVMTVAEAMALPPGTRFLTPDGQLKVRP